MKPLYFLAILLLFTACKKEKVTPQSEPIQYSKPDFALIPTKNAKWYVHTQGIQGGSDVFSYSKEYYVPRGEVDTAFHIYTTVEALGRDTLIEGYSFHLYSVVRIIRNTRDKIIDSFHRNHPLYFRYYLMEDTLKKKVYSGYNSYFNEFYTVLDFSDSANNGTTKVCQVWPQMNIVNADYVVAGQQLKGWDVQNTYDKNRQCFYKAIGIGSITGVLPFQTVADNWGQVISLDFVYKADSIHFDFPLR
jgi:hypothetical protein